MKKISICSTIATFLLLCMLSAASANALVVRIVGDRLSLQAYQVPLQDILKKIAGLGINVRIDPQLNPPITASFNDRDIQKGVASILKSCSHILIWKTLKGSSGPIARLVEIQVFKPGEKGRMESLIKSLNLPISRNPKDGTLFVKDEILLKLDPKMDLLGLERLLRRLGGTVIDSNIALRIYRIRLPENSDIPSILEQFAHLPGIGKAEPNYAYPISVPNAGSDSYRTGHYKSEKMPAEDAIPVAVLDTGLSLDYGLEKFILASMDVFDPEKPISDVLGHGTQMALIAAGVIKPEYDAYDTYRAGREFETFNPIIPIRIFDDNGYTSNFNIMHAIDFALGKGAKVMSLSWGSEIRSDFLEDALDYAKANGIIVVASAGNEPTGRSVYPAAYTSVIGVGALDPVGKAWKKSNYGDFVTMYAPGFASFPVGYKGDPGAYAGTSISTAFVANVIANYIGRNPKTAIKEIINALTKSKQKQ